MLGFQLFAKAFLAIALHFSIYRHFFRLCVLPFLVPLSVFFKQKFCLHESLFLDKNLNQSCFLDIISNQIDSLILYLIIFILCDHSSFGWVAVVVADAGGVDGRFRCSDGSVGWVAVAVADAGGVDGQFWCSAGSFGWVAVVVADAGGV
jgi:hypothetical protein